MLEQNPLITICMICYNHEKYIEQSIESVINQTYQNWELIIVDNASIDRSCELLDRYQDPRIKKITLEFNSFVSYASNLGIKNANGEYIAILSADDYFETNKLEKQIRYMQETNSDVCFTWINPVNDSSEIIDHVTGTVFNRDFSNFENLLKIFITEGNVLCAVTPVIKRTVFDKVGYFDHRLLQTQDFDFWLRLAKYYKIDVLPEKLTNYRVRDDGENLSIKMTKPAILRSNFEAVYFLKHILNFDVGTLSSIIGTNCTQENKFIRMFEFYLLSGNYIAATSILQALYEDLGSKFEFPSAYYADFFSIYSSFDAFNCLGVRGAITELYCDSGNGFETAHVQHQYNVNKTSLSFDIGKLKNIKKLRFDPINVASRIQFFNAYITDMNGNKYSLAIIENNCDSIADGCFTYFHNDPIWIFNFPETVKNYHEFNIEFDVIETIGSLLINNHLRKINQDITTEIENHIGYLKRMENSFSWRITKPLRILMQKIETLKSRFKNK